MDPRVQHRGEVEALARKRLPVAMAAVILFIGGALPVEAYYYPEHLLPYAAVYLVELALCAFAYAAVSWRPRHAQAIAVAWAGAMGLCVAGYYPLVDGDATLAMAALICLVAAMPAIMPFGLRHQATLGILCFGALVTVIALGVRSSLPLPYVFIALLSVVSLSSIGAHSMARYRWEAYQREACLRQAHDHLRTALARAETAAEMRSRLVANVSHELRTPLNVIVGYTDMIMDDGADPSAVAAALPRLRDYAVSLEALVTELLDLSRLSHKVALTIEDVDVAELLGEIAEGTRLQLRGRPVVVRVECGLARFRSDRMRLRQILTNLATNAAKFTPRGSITIRAREERGHAVLEVQDTGCGIPAAKHEQIFTAFEQVTPGSSGKDGVGLGLAIVRQLTDVLCGAVTVASAPGCGATFTVTLPGAQRSAGPALADEVEIAATVGPALSSPVS